MSVQLRMTRRLYESMRGQLRRPHPFAAERVGFAYGRRGATPKGDLVLLAEFVDVADDDYEDDPSVGARIGSTAIHNALQRALDLKAASFHVHLHEHAGMPWFSRVDRQELPDVVRPFRVLVPDQPYGLILLSDDDCTGLVWMPGETRARGLREVLVVGAPLRTLRGER
jgi:hypothetical protein